MISLIAPIALSAALFSQLPSPWTEPFPPHKIVGNVYYVGSAGLASYLITSPDGHILINSNLETSVPQAVPFKGTPIVVCDDDGRRARLAAATLERIGYRQVSVLDGGINRWVTDGLIAERA